MSESPRRLDINSSAIRIAGVGGLGMVALVVLIAADLQPARWLLAAGVGGGAAVAAGLIAWRRNRPQGTSGSDQPISLFEAHTAEQSLEPDAGAKRQPDAPKQLLARG